MKINVDTSRQLVQIALGDSLFEKLVKQVEKDFILANNPLKITKTIDGVSFIALIREKVYYLMMEHFAEYLNLMYIIDIPEKEFEHIQITDTVDVADQITFLILKREYKKVWYRNRYQ
ncbi:MULTISPECIES: hypothetical protein [Maribacter]|uniref:hypothetical protein n=1 Tax=Maribacter TaxID=252356 RepID=UPI000C08B72D|nr:MULTISPECIES: hypothetical protein [Maribacter]PHN94483.1 hypothetical protein CSC80_03780 [Maribacter sp. 6B07]CAG2533195.1 hypothetical protein MAR621_03582 [Maribacter dokdonensis]|tara:strand:- start:110 stop:463 length:354 start_codon:yes stop_codon:yes gene_type:complete